MLKEACKRRREARLAGGITWAKSTNTATEEKRKVLCEYGSNRTSE